MSPDEQIRWALPGGLRGHPEFKIFRPIIGPVTVDVVDVLARQQRPSKLLRHDRPVL
jgi:hypothetical protein